MFNVRLRNCASRLSLAVALAFSAEVQAQSEPADDDEPEDEIIVTGTRIPRKDLSASSPVATFDREEMTEFGAVALEEFVNTLPQIKPNYGKTSNNPGDGTSAIDLRGLGAGRTLVLLNGRRIAPSGTGSAIDVNAIPSAMIERVEVVSGGASAVYGSDAVTGAVNFITRKDFKGLEASAQADVYGAGDGQVYTGSIVGGLDFADGRGHVAVFGDFVKRKPVLQGDREFTATVVGEIGGALVPSGSSVTPAGRTRSGGPSLVFNQDGTVRPFVSPADLYNFALLNYLQAPQERWSGGAFAEFEATESIELHTELMYSRPTSSRQLAPPPATFTAPLVINGPFFPASTRTVLTTRYDPDGDGRGNVVFSKRFEDTGPRRFRSERDYYRGVLGLRADLGSSWRLDGYYSYGRNDNSVQLDNAVSLSRVLQGLRIDPVTGQCTDPSNGCVAVNIFGAGNISPAGQDFIRVNGLANEYSSVQHNAALIATGDLFTWSQGTVQTSGGVEFRRNVASAEADPALATGDALGFNSFAGAQGAIDLYEVFAEMLIPLLDDRPFARHLEIELGGRYSNYSTAGGVFTWKAGGQWRPFDGLRFSGMWQRAVRAPNIDELFTNPVTFLDEVDLDTDFCAASQNPAARGLAPVCIAQGMSPAAIGVYDPLPGDVFFSSTEVGNPDLGVERAGSITAGFDYTFDLPVTLRIGADYFAITLGDAVAAAFPFDLCPIVADPASEICGLIVRDPSGEPIAATYTPLNVAVARTRGVDLTLDFGTNVPEALGLGEARFSIRSAATWYFELGIQQTEKSAFVDCAGLYGPVCGVSFAGGGLSFDGITYPAHLVSTSFSLDKGPFSGSLRWRWMSGQENADAAIAQRNGFPPDPNTAIFSIPAKHYVDLAASYRLFENVRLRAGVDNVMKTRPPLLGNQQFQGNTDPTRYDVFGRRFYVGVDIGLWRH